MKTFKVSWNISRGGYIIESHTEYIQAETEEKAKESAIERIKLPTKDSYYNIFYISETIPSSENSECETCSHQVYCIGQCMGNCDEEDD